MNKSLYVKIVGASFVKMNVILGSVMIVIGNIYVNRLLLYISDYIDILENLRF